MAGEQTDTTTKAVGNGDPLSGLSDAELSKFELTGELPGKTAAPAETEGTEKAEHDAEAAAAEPVEQAASRDATTEAAPEAAKPEKKKPGQKKDAATRAAEIDRDAEEAERKLEAALTRRRRAQDALREVEREDREPKRAERDREAAAPATDPKAPAWKRFREMPDAPKSDQFESLDDYAAAMGHFVAEKIAEEKFNTLYESRSAADRAAQEASQQWETAAKTGFERASKELESDAELLDRIDPRLHALQPMHQTPAQERTPAHYVKDRCLLHSNNPLKLLAWLSENGGAEMSRIARMSAEGIVDAISRQDARFDLQSEESEAQASTAGERQHPRVSRAQAPAPDLGKKAAAKDPRKAPGSYDDFDSWNLEETRGTVGARR